MTANAYADETLAYVREHGPKAALAVVAVACEEIAKEAGKEPARTLANINAAYVRETMRKMA